VIMVVFRFGAVIIDSNLVVSQESNHAKREQASSDRL